MDIAQRIPIAATWGMHGGGWWMLGAAVMMIFMGGMMWMMMRGMGGGSSSGPNESRRTTQSPLDILERRFAQGEISIEEYRERRLVLTNGSRRGEPEAGDQKREEVVERAAGKEPS